MTLTEQTKILLTELGRDPETLALCLATALANERMWAERARVLGEELTFFSPLMAHQIITNRYGNPE